MLYVSVCHVLLSDIVSCFVLEMKTVAHVEPDSCFACQLWPRSPLWVLEQLLSAVLGIPRNPLPPLPPLPRGDQLPTTHKKSTHLVSSTRTSLASQTSADWRLFVSQTPWPTRWSLPCQTMALSPSAAAGFAMAQAPGARRGAGHPNGDAWWRSAPTLRSLIAWCEVGTWLGLSWSTFGHPDGTWGCLQDRQPRATSAICVQPAPVRTK